jgi:hypothetical protein
MNHLCVLCDLCERIKKLLAEIAEIGEMKFKRWITPIWSYKIKKTRIMNLRLGDWAEKLRIPSADFAFSARGKRSSLAEIDGDYREEIKK